MRVNLKRNEEIRLLEGNPWVFGNEVNRITGFTFDGDITEVYSFENKFVGYGFINTNSKILVRILSYDHNELINEEFFEKRIIEANSYRVDLGYKDNYRVVFGEADFLPGLVVDKYGDYLVVQLASLGMDIRKEIILKALIKVFNPKGIYERSDLPLRKKEGLEQFKGLLYGEVPPLVIIEENGIKLNVDIINGQKTGYFLDQKENRDNIKHYVKGKTFLDCFSHTGGFALNACKNGAKEVTAADISALAIENIKRNAALNNFSLNTIEVDVFKFLRETEKKYDVIVLDPPAFTKTKDKIEEALRGYKEINSQALRLINKGGYLITCSCSQHITPDLFLGMLMEASVLSKRKTRIVEFRIQAKDHPTSIFSEDSLYLKCVVLHVI